MVSRDSRIARFMFLVFVLLLVVGCSARRPAIVQPTTIYRDVAVHDTIIRYDSISIKDSVIIETKADTVFKTRWRTEYKWLTIDKIHDSIRIERDTITVTQVVEKKLGKMNNACLLIGRVFLILLGGALIFYGIKIARRFIV